MYIGHTDGSSTIIAKDASVKYSVLYMYLVHNMHVHYNS